MTQGNTELRIGLETKEKLIIGTGEFELKPSRYIQVLKIKRGGNEVPIIPGSSIKGMLRINASKIAYMFNMHSCQKIKPDEIAQAHDEKHCDVCEIFGAPNKPSKIIVSDANICDERIVYNNYTGISINPMTRTTQKRALFQQETVSMGHKFEFILQTYNLTEKELELLLYSIKELEYSGIGRNGSRVVIAVKNMNEIAAPLQQKISEVFA